MSEKRAPTSKSTGGAFGPNAWLVDDMYEQYRSDPSSVSESWREFFADYVPPGAPGAPGAVAPTATPTATATAGTPGVATAVATSPARVPPGLSGPTASGVAATPP